MSILVVVAWLPTWMYFNHMLTGYAECHQKKHATDDLSAILLQEYECYAHKFGTGERGNDLSIRVEENIFRGVLSPWIEYLQEGHNSFIAFEFLTSAAEQIPGVEVYGSIGASILLLGYLVCSWTTFQRSSPMSRRESFLTRFRQQVQARAIPLKNLWSSNGRITPSTHHQQESIQVSEFLSSLEKNELWSAGTSPAEGQREPSEKERAVKREALAFALCFAVVHWLIPPLCRMGPLNTELSAIPWSSGDRAFSQLFGNFVLAAALLVLAYSLRCASYSYSKHTSQLFAFKAMWHPPTLDFMLHNWVMAQHSEKRPSTSFRNPVEETIYMQFTEMSQHERVGFITSFRFFDLHQTDIDNTQAWWSIREAMLLRQTGERLNMEFLLMLVVAYVAACLLWVLVKICQHDYTATNSMNLVLLWDVVGLGLLAQGGMRACLRMNRVFQDELVGLMEVRNRLYGFKSIALEGGCASLLRCLASRSAVFPDQAQEAPASLQISRLEAQLRIDSLLEHLKLVDEHATLCGVRIDESLQLRLMSLVVGVGSTVAAKMIVGVILHIRSS